MTDLPKKSINDLLLDLLKKPEVLEKAQVLLGVKQKSTSTRRVRNYVVIEITTECLTCGKISNKTISLKEGENIVITNKDGSCRTIKFDNIHAPISYQTHTVWCESCKQYVQELDRASLEERFCELAQISSIMWRAYRHNHNKNNTKVEMPKGFPPIERKTLQERLIKKGCDDDDELGEALCNTPNYLDDTDKLPDWEADAEERDERGDIDISDDEYQYEELRSEDNSSLWDDTEFRGDAI